MKQLIVLVVLVLAVACRPKFSAITNGLGNLTSDSSYVMFEADSVHHTVALGWTVCKSVDSIKEGRVVDHMSVWYVQWPVPMVDSLHHKPLIDHTGHDSVVMGWLPLREDAILWRIGRRHK